MGKIKISKSLIIKAGGGIIFALLAIIGTLVLVLYGDLKGAIKENTDTLKQTSTQITEMRFDFVRAHPELARAAYSIGKTAQTYSFTTDTSQSVFDLLMIAPSTGIEQLRTDLSLINGISDAHVGAISAAYYEAPPDWTPMDFEAISHGFEMVRTPELFFPVHQTDVMADLMPPWLLWPVPLLAGLLLVIILVFSWLDEEED